MTVSVRLLSYNIKFGGRARDQAIANVIRAAAPDVVLLQEATDRNVVARLAELTGLPNWDSRPNYSTGYLTKLPVAEHKWTRPRGSRHAFLEVAFEQPELRLFCLHLSAWFNDWSEWRRRIEIQSLLNAIRAHQDGAHIIAGDFNALAPGALLQTGQMPRWIRAMVWLSGRDIARRTIQHMLDRKYVDVFRSIHPTEDGYTFPTWNPHVRLDYIFTPEKYAKMMKECRVLVSKEGASASDHYPLLAEVEVP